MAAGREHAVVATSDGKVFTWGGRDLLTGRKGNTREPGQALVRGGRNGGRRGGRNGAARGGQIAAAAGVLGGVPVRQPQ